MLKLKFLFISVNTSTTTPSVFWYLFAPYW